MSSHRVFNGVDDAVKQSLESYWEKKLPRLEKLLVRNCATLCTIWLTAS